MNLRKEEVSQKNTQNLEFEPYIELSELINKALQSGYPEDSLLSTLVFTTEELARTTNNLNLLGDIYGK
tara:strand:- start:361 stop:567 length:207 start_codon:yes stop_codon:yes gene_type:complete